MDYFFLACTCVGTDAIHTVIRQGMIYILTCENIIFAQLIKNQVILCIDIQMNKGSVLCVLLFDLIYQECCYGLLHWKWHLIK